MVFSGLMYKCTRPMIDAFHYFLSKQRAMNVQQKNIEKTERDVNVGIFLRSTRVRKYYKFDQHITIFQIETCATDMRAKETLNKSPDTIQ